MREKKLSDPVVPEVHAVRQAGQLVESPPASGMRRITATGLETEPRRHDTVMVVLDTEARAASGDAFRDQVRTFHPSAGLAPFLVPGETRVLRVIRPPGQTPAGRGSPQPRETG